MKYCSHCGKQVLDDAIICPGCGCSVQYPGTGNDGFSKTNNYTQQQQQQHVPPQTPPYADNYSALCVAGLIMSFFQPLIGLILSIIANNEAKRTGSSKSLSLSKAGIIISSVILGIIALWIIICIILVCVPAFIYL